MAPSLCIDLSHTEREQLLYIARESLHSGLHQGSPHTANLDEAPDFLTWQLGVFVTLTRQGKLCGCIGSMHSDEPLARSVAESAYKAGFQDPRFAPLQAQQLDKTRIEISILSPMEPLSVESRSELLSALRPTLDGLLLQDRHYRSTFLPKVWEQLPDPEVFLEHLLTKAGLPVDHWSETMRFFRYQTVSFSETSGA